ncbi:unnamed protein product [Cercopithifilaria johnstoni]|uniref:Uncharacterized protein n=1 Tax=Cercopithifilaria johnstoni TaxID=2874296 RepID=A0A8J2MQ46_9BILA|nr:unnamed protein product [Cercopithifilaria johnstoni]
MLAIIRYQYRSNQIRPSVSSNTNTTTKMLQPHSFKVNKPRPNENPSTTWKQRSITNPRWATMTLAYGNQRKWQHRCGPLIWSMLP